jgi:hypothetical protein
MQFRNGSNKGTASNFVQILEKCDADPDSDQASIQGRKHEPYTESPNSLRSETGEEQSQQHDHHCP